MLGILKGEGFLIVRTMHVEEEVFYSLLIGNGGVRRGKWDLPPQQFRETTHYP